jgi:hypothetical protein
MGEECGTHGGSGEVHIGVLSKQLRKRDYMEDLCADERVILKRTLKVYVGRAWTGWTVLAQGRTSVQLLSTLPRIFSFHKIQRVS